MTLVISKWDPLSVKQNRLFLIIGRRGSGKTTLLEDLMFNFSLFSHSSNNHPKFDISMSFCPTHDSRKMMEKHIPPCFSYSSYDGDVVRKLNEECKSLKERGKGRQSLLVLDDCMFDSKFMKETVMKEICMNGRNYGITMVNCVQYIMDMPVALRSQIDYVIVLAENIKANRERLWKYFFGVFKTFAEFQTVFENTTNNYRALVLDNTTPTSDISKCVFWYKASDCLPEFRLGKPIFWHLSKNNKHVVQNLDNGVVTQDKQKVSSIILKDKLEQ
jgi:hypothetical protein